MKRSRRLQRLIDRQRAVCPLCGNRIRTSDKANIDYRLPRSKGGSNALHNLQATHVVCNLRKGAKLIDRLMINGDTCRLPPFCVPTDLLWNVNCDCCLGPTKVSSVCDRSVVWMQCTRCGEITRVLIDKLLAERRTAH